ncbi:MAG TPA: hypothetical protein DCS13_03300 [Candidatus Margulisbacteria bacterium]|nr:hypothetical protein [Candidatus Margulisiibacteriota bacterium]
MLKQCEDTVMIELKQMSDLTGFIRTHRLSGEDLREIQLQGKDLREVVNNYNVLVSEKKQVKLIKPATEEEGLISIDNLLDDLAYGYEAIENKPVKFTPMSGAASRMFGFLESYYQNASDDDNEKVNTFIKGLDERQPGPHFSFVRELKDVLKRDNLNLSKLVDEKKYKTIISYVLNENGLNYRNKPKALIPFHVQNGRAILALEAQMEEALRYGNGNLFITILHEHQDQFIQAIEKIKKENNELSQVYIHISEQYNSTNTIAIDPATKEIVRNNDGKISFFPAGHGALIKNLPNSGPSILRNVDNVTSDEIRKQVIDKYHKAFSVYLSQIKTKVSTILTRLDADSISETDLRDQMFALQKQGFQLIIDNDSFSNAPFDEMKRIARIALNRPIKIVGVVKNQGEPGGGPFIIEYGDYRIISIVEKDEIPLEQKSLMEKGKYFNPVDILADPVDYKGNFFDLTEFINKSRYFIVSRRFLGKEVKRMEHPGLWNGTMDGWNSIYVVMPNETFAPVKEVNDLLRLEHQ